jgi:purine-binding chemotaxis protein CheW
VIKGQATEIVDVAHFLPLAFEDWRNWKEREGSQAARSVLLVDDAAFFRNMLAPVLKAAGYAVTTAASASDALALLQRGRRFDVVVTDIVMPGMDESTVEYVTAMIGGQLFGLPISRVQDVFVPERLTRVPLAGPDIAGLLNLRGRIVTVIDMRCRLDLEAQERVGRQMAVGVEHRGESYGLLIDEIGEVLKLQAASREDNPVNLDGRLARVSAGVHRLEGRLLVILDVERVLDAGVTAVAA